MGELYAYPRYYDAIYHFKDYRAEAASLRARLHGLGIADGARLFDAGCGTGAHLVELAPHFRVSGCDLSPPMIEHAKTKLPEVGLFVADMAELSIGEPVDVLVSLFGAIGHVYFDDRLRAAAAAFSRAVRPGGAIAIEPWLTEDEFKPGRRVMHTYDREELKLCRAVIAQREGPLSVLEFHWLALEEGSTRVKSFTTLETLWLCPHARLLAALDEAGFDVELDRNGLMPGRSLILGRRRLT